MEKVKEALLNDAAAWSVFAALLMTVGFAALTISNGDFDEDNEMNDFVSVLYVIFNSLSGGLSFLAVIQGTQTYSYYNNLPPIMMDKAIARSKQFNVAPIVYVAIFAQGMGVTAGVYLLFGVPAYWFGLIIALICFFSIFLLLYLQRASYVALGLTQGVLGVNDKNDDDENKMKGTQMET